MTSNDMLTAAQTAQLLGISITSIRNWERHEYLTRQNGGYRKADVHKLLEMIKSGEINRLNHRANKKQTPGTISPAAEYRALCDAVSTIELDGPSLMFLLALKQFTDTGQVRRTALADLLNFKPGDYGTDALLNHFKKRFMQLKTSMEPGFYPAAETMMNLCIPKLKPSKTDIAGIIYQAIRRRGDRSASGSFYTAPEVSASMIASALRSLKTESPLFMDPCCGTGQFMLSFIAAGGRPESTYGMDSDSTAAFTAASNILLECPELEFQPMVFACDSLLHPPINIPSAFDLIATNPPWGACNSEKKAELEVRYPGIKSGESYSYFISRAFELSKAGGIVSMVLPESITNVKMHKDIRETILYNGRITEVRKLGKVFKGVYTSVITLEILAGNQSENKITKVRINSSNQGFSLPESNFISAPNLDFNININSSDSRIIDKVYSIPHTTLKGKADWALGIVTGDNNKYVKTSPEPHHEPIIKGGDITPGRINQPQHFIRWDSRLFQQTAPEWKYRVSEKLVYRFISKRLIFAVDRSGSLTLNSANILIPRIGKIDIDSVPLKFTYEQIIQLFNSDLYNFIFRKKFNSVKVLRSHLEELPLPLMKANNNIRQTFMLTESEMAIIKESLTQPF